MGGQRAFRERHRTNGGTPFAGKLARRTLDEEDFLYSRQVNLETIHAHDVLAERHGTVAEIRTELATGEPQARHTDLASWLAA